MTVLAAAAALALPVGAGAIAAAPAQAAGTFNQYLGSLPGGASTPAGPWSNVSYGGTGGGSFGVNMPVDSGGGWTSTASLGPAANLPWSSATATRSYNLPVSWAVYQPRATTSWETVGWTGGGYGGASDSGTVTVNNPASLSITVGCYTGGGGSDPNPRCAAGGNWIASQIKLVVRDEDFPTAALANAGGQMLNGQWQTSTAIPLEVTASDVGGGAYRAYVTDGTTTIYSRLDPSNPRCADATPGSGTDYDFTASSSSLVPCKTASQAYTPTFDLTPLGDGSHSGLTFGVEDVAGNKTIVASNRTVKLNMPSGSLPDEGTACTGGGTYAADGTTCNAPLGGGTTPPTGGGPGPGISTPGAPKDKGDPATPSAPTDTPAPTPPAGPIDTPVVNVPVINGGNAGPALMCTSSSGKGCKGKAKNIITVTSKYGQRLALTGKVVNAANGKPISGAVVTVTTTDTVPGASAAGTTTVHTNASGVYKYLAPMGPSRTITFAYTYKSDEQKNTGSSTVVLAVAARATVKPNARYAHNGNTVAFSGRVLGAPKSASTKVELQAYVPESGWRTIGSTSVRNGKYTVKYRFGRTTGTNRYEFRVHVLPSAGWPFDEGFSKKTKVTVSG